MGLHPVTKRTQVLLLVAVLLLLVSASATTPHRSRRRRPQCQRPPGFRVNNIEPMAIARGHVTLVALLTSTCSFCISQSRRLQSMHEGFQANGTDVHMMIVNGSPRRPPQGEPGVFENIVSFPVYHDDNGQTIWRQVFLGSKDDIFIFDRCGQLTYRIPFPYSYLGYSYVAQGLQRTLTGNVCPCEPQDPHDMMMGDAPPLGASGLRNLPFRLNRRRNPRGRARASQSIGRKDGRNFHPRYMNRSRCPRGDRLCRDLRNARRRYNRYRRTHGIGTGSRMRELEILRVFQRSQRGSMGPAL